MTNRSPIPADYRRQPVAPAELPASASILWGKVYGFDTPSPTQAYRTLHPCDPDGGNVVTDVSITASIPCADGSFGNVLPQLPNDTIVPYVSGGCDSYGTAIGVIVGIPYASDAYSLARPDDGLGVYEHAVQLQLSGSWLDHKIGFAGDINQNSAQRGVHLTLSGGDPNGAITARAAHAVCKTEIGEDDEYVLFGDDWISLGNNANDGLLHDLWGHLWSDDDPDEYIVAFHNTPQAESSTVSTTNTLSIVTAESTTYLRCTSTAISIDARGHVRGLSETSAHTDLQLYPVTVGEESFYAFKLPS